ncbi:PleD family two-component system response regulator [Oscillatoria sp. FACHB-1407]|uniref:GGDEF domain-containing response regulator n=1 Tax=Oscillatoria sp. FACHB-1407 TaxID=2692847 RepID=UPI0016831406|nr:PleD family two-component system response regulator [Oscillatoria sp. FACHB-1407]MBD2465140.1 PleD family two-component system response regulator [Oscillatoria sp. FACHB-1407]
MHSFGQDKTPLILVVDDQKMLRLTLRRSLEKEGYRVIEASNGEECLALWQNYDLDFGQGEEQIPDMILLDAIMPQMDGFACCARLHDRLGDRCPPVLMITALDDEKSVDLAFEVGATDYITKPIHWAVLRQRVRRVLQARWAMAEQQRLLAELRATMALERSLKEQLEIANHKLERLASIDGLTQLANRRSFDLSLQQEWQRLNREQAPLTLILCDIDYFKAYNDSYGHIAGDECLRQVAALLQETVKRPADLVARYGGEEFALILPNTGLDGAIRLVETIQTHLRRRAIAHAGSSVNSIITVSIGIASTVPHTKLSPHELIDQADQALYRAKLQGRDRYCVYQRVQL